MEPVLLETLCKRKSSVRRRQRHKWSGNVWLESQMSAECLERHGVQRLDWPASGLSSAVLKVDGLDVKPSKTPLLVYIYGGPILIFLHMTTISFLSRLSSSLALMTLHRQSQ